MQNDSSESNPFRPPAVDENSISDSSLRQINGTMFSFEGRISRAEFSRVSTAGTLIFVGVACFGVFVAQFGIQVLNSGLIVLTGGIAVCISCIVWTWLLIALCVKRLHDRNQAGTQVLYGLLPIGGWIWLFIECGFLPGTEGDNDYGPEPDAE